MADSTRRSGRATKGQHRGLEDAEAAPPKKATSKGKKGGKIDPSPPPEEEDDGDAIIRCICGCTTEDEDDDRKMICCEKCEAWQHNECMEVSENDDELPEKYFCEQCRPRDHKALLAKVGRGQKPWEERAREREREEEERKARKGKGKKGRKGRASAAKKEEVETNGAPGVGGDTVMTEATPEEVPKPIPDVVPESPQVNNSKRKLPDEPTPDSSSSSQAEPANKLRKASSPTIPVKPPLQPPSRRKSSGPAPMKRDSNAATLQTELVDRIEDLQVEERRRVATAFSKLFEGQVKQAQKDGSFSLAEGQSVNDYALKLALSVEYAIYLNFFGTSSKPSEQYGDKFRAINHNVKANPSLRDRVLNGDLSPNDLSKMSRDDMASKELQEKKAEMMKEAEKQHMLIQEEGPRIRRTHKGEELVNDENHLTNAADTNFTAPIRKRPSEIDTTMKDASPEPMSARSPEAVELPGDIGAASPDTKEPLSIDTQAPPLPSAAPERKSSSTFNIQDVWSGVKGPDPDMHRSRQTSRPSEPSAPPVKQQPDAEIDQLLKDEEPEDEEPYSPVDHTADPNAAVWHGRMAMAGIASFSGKARHVAGADLSSSLPWSQLIPDTLTIEGRIDTARADEYLCGLRYSNTTDVVVVAVTASETPDDLAQFDKLFKYFTERKRYGVISKNPVPSVKDTYVVPLEAGAPKKPEFVELLDYCTIQVPSPERTLLLSFVLKMNNSPPTQQTPRQPDAASLNSPITVSGQQLNPIGGHSGFQNSQTPGMPYPPTQQYPGYAGSPQQGQEAYMPPHPAQQQSPYPNQQPQQYGPTGMEAARQALGDLANVPVIAELLNEAPNSGVAEFMVVRDLLERVPACQNDYKILRGMLAQRLQQQGQGGA
ncbi:MAG: hypothetical protein Q9217_004628 [Psora testacea]